MSFTFRRRADDLHPALRQPVPHRRERGAGPGARGGDRVVSARVTDRRQRVVLAHDRDRWSGAGLEGRAERGLHTAHAALHLEALAAEELRQPAGRLHLFVRELGMVVDPERQSFQIVAQALDGLVDKVFHRAHGLSPK
jgi:hypothetical protein